MEPDSEPHIRLGQLVRCLASVSPGLVHSAKLEPCLSGEPGARWRFVLGIETERYQAGEEAPASIVEALGEEYVVTYRPSGPYGFLSR